MKHLATLAPTRLLAFFVLLLLPAPRAIAADARDESLSGRKVATVTTSLITPFFDAYYLEGKIRASKNFAVAINASALSIEKGDWTTRAGTVGAGVDYFFQGDALRRWYVEAIGELWLASPRHGPSGSIAPFGMGYAGIALIGYQFVFDLGLVVDLGMGAVAFHLPAAAAETAGGSVSAQATTSVYPAAKLNVGWAF
jgi:hypothetical protein